jgi:hypothetical protein
MDDELYAQSLAMLDRIDEIQLAASVRQRGDDFKLTVESNLDDIVLDTLKETMSEELQAVQEELLERIEGEIGTARNEVEELIIEREAYLENTLSEAERRLIVQHSRIEQKREEIDGRVRAEEERIQREAEEELQKQREKIEDKGEELIDSLL